VTLAEVTHVPYPDDSFEMVFSCGLLIHVPDVDLPSVLDEMYRLSTKWLLVMEYHSPEWQEIEYRGERGLLWKRPYDDMLLKRFPLLKLVEEGFLAPEDGFDNLTFGVFSK
jgi:ubiquinone/menaquinone biosynthesis C-methylase UbiE